MDEVPSDTIQSIDTIIPSGLSTSTYLPAARRDPDLERRFQINRQYHFRQTILPPALVLCGSTLLMGLGWFLLDPTSALRDNAMGTYIPIMFFTFAVSFGGLATLLAMQAASLRRKVDDSVV